MHLVRELLRPAWPARTPSCILASRAAVARNSAEGPPEVPVLVAAGVMVAVVMVVVVVVVEMRRSRKPHRQVAVKALRISVQAYYY